jgi:hypothetical protein
LCDEKRERGRDRERNEIERVRSKQKKEREEKRRGREKRDRRETIRDPLVDDLRVAVSLCSPSESKMIRRSRRSLDRQT